LKLKIKKYKVQYSTGLGASASGPVARKTIASVSSLVSPADPTASVLFARTVYHAVIMTFKIHQVSIPLSERGPPKKLFSILKGI